jgi:hypothetical protein
MTAIRLFHLTTNVMLLSLPVVCFDESGNTGQDLLNEDQPVFVLASTRLNADDGLAIARDLAGVRAAEAKFSKLRKTEAGCRRILKMFEDPRLSPDSVRITIYHKSFMITTKIVDTIVETFHYDHGIDLYENAANLGLANLLHMVMPVFCGADEFRELQVRFVDMVRRKSDLTIDAFYAQVDLLRRTNTDAEFSSCLSMLAATRSVVHEAIHDMDPTALDPAIPAFVEQAAQWTATIGTPFELVHDESTALDVDQHRMALLMSVKEEPRVFDYMGTRCAFPIQATGIRLADSRCMPQLQVADVIAGSIARLMRARARRTPDGFADDLARSGLVRLISGGVWPDREVTPQGLEAHRRPGSVQVDFVAGLVARGQRPN